MAIMKPFCGVRPRRDLAEKIAALPYDVYSREEAGAEVKKQPLSFLKIDRAETQFDEKTDPYAPCVYEKARELLYSMIKEGSFIIEQKEAYYIYELTMDGRSQTGIGACASIDDYLNQVIKKHENTREEKEQDRIRHVDTLNAQTGPIFLAYRAQAELDRIVEIVKEKPALYDFVSQDGVRHRFWAADGREEIHNIYRCFENISSIYIADGHHRAASAVKAGLKRRAQNPQYQGNEEFNYFLCVLFPHDQLEILSYNRLVSDLNGLSQEKFVEEISKSFLIKETDGPFNPKEKGTFGMYLKEKWYSLKAKDGIIKKDAVEGLDVSILQNEILGPVLGILDPRSNKRIDFVGGIRGLEELERRCHMDMQLAFSLYPTSIEELFCVADAGRLMPPKSTWFEPKLRSGLLLHLL